MLVSILPMLGRERDHVGNVDEAVDRHEPRDKVTEKGNTTR